MNSVFCLCNKQRVEENKDSIRQVGLIIGGLEKYRDEIKVLANLISKKDQAYLVLLVLISLE